MKFISLIITAVAVICSNVLAVQSKSIYDFTVKDIQGNDVQLSKYKGKVLLIVNVASNCGLTDTNYKQLNELYDTYQEKGLRILAFPSNQFMQQEPGTNKEIQDFVTKKYNVKFDMFAKIDVNGENADPLYKFLKEQQPGSNKDDASIEWNFAKFIVDKEGNVVERHVPKKEPLTLKESIEKYL